MTKEQINQLIETTLKEKKKNDVNYIRYTFFELKVKYSLSEDEVDVFLKLARDLLIAEEYDVYFTGTRYEYNHSKMMVQANEILIAVKNE